METKKIDDFFIEIKKITVAHKFLYKKNAVYKFLEGRKTCGLVHILSGKLCYKFTDGRVAVVCEGDTFFLKSSDAYKVICIEECEHYTVNFETDEASAEGSATELLKKGINLLKHSEKNSFKEEPFADISELWKTKKTGYRMNAISIAYKLLYSFVRKLNESVADYNAVLLAPAKEYIETHWKEKISLEELAAMCHISVAHFRHTFINTFGIAPIQYRDSIRLLYAKDYLSQPEYNITEIAYKCGFNDFNYFSRFFKKHTGKSPREYKLSTI